MSIVLKLNIVVTIKKTTILKEFNMARRKSPPVPPSQVELDYREFGNALRKLIKAKGYTQEGFAEAIGVSYSSMMSILKGERRVYLHVYAKMLDVLGVSDLVFMSDFANQPDMVHKAELYMRLVSKLDTMPTEVLENILGLVSVMETRD